LCSTASGRQIVVPTLIQSPNLAAPFRMDRWILGFYWTS
jgi:hypothetical protein